MTDKLSISILKAIKAPQNVIGGAEDMVTPGADV